MKLSGRIPVESLDEERLVNIERRIVANAKIGPAEHAPRRHLAFAGGLLAVAAAAIVGWKLRGAGGAIPDPEPPQSIAVATDAQRSTLALEGATIASEPGTTFDVTREAGKVVVKMTRGKLDLAVEHREHRLLVVRAGDTDVEDVGTKFSVTWDGAGDVDVRVREGAVKVKHAHQELLVAKDQEWRPGSGVVAITEVAAASATAGSAESKPADDHAGSAAFEVAVKDPGPVLHDRHAAVPEPRPHPVARASSEAPAPGLTEPVVVAKQAAAIKAASDPYVDLKLAIRRQPLAFDPRIDGQGDATAEIARLKKIAYSPTTLGDEPSRALYSIAVLLHKPLKQDAEALRTLDVYRRRFGDRGKERAAALWLKVRITCGRAIDDECRKAAYGYQHDAPTGEAADVAVRITNAQ
jgi:hypothetical protein